MMQTTMAGEDSRGTLRPVYVGAAEYQAGLPLPLEKGVDDAGLCAQLRHPDHGSDQFPYCGAPIVELLEGAIRRSLHASGRSASDIDAVFYVSNQLDARNNLDVEWLGQLHQRLGMSHVPHYHVGIVGCGGFHWAARLAAGLVASGQCKQVLIASFDKAGDMLQRVYGQGTDFPYLTGDAAAACLFSSSPDRLDYRLAGPVINVVDGAQALQASMDSEIRCIGRMFRQAYEAAGLQAEDIGLLITNNYSYNVSRLYCQLAGLSYSKAFVETIPTHAHCFGSDNVINLSHAGPSGRVGAEQYLMLFSTGPFQWGACVLQKLSSVQGR